MENNGNYAANQNYPENGKKTKLDCLNIFLILHTAFPNVIAIAQKYCFLRFIVHMFCPKVKKKKLQ